MIIVIAAVALGLLVVYCFWPGPADLPFEDDDFRYSSPHNVKTNRRVCSNGADVSNRRAMNRRVMCSRIRHDHR